MATQKILKSTALIIETENGTDKNGNTLYAKKTFSNIKSNVDLDKIYATAEAIKKVLAKDAEGYYIKDMSALLPQG